MTAATSTLCAIMKNEAGYIPEWVAYHRAIGFDRILILDNESTDSTTEMLTKLQGYGLLQTVPWATRTDTHNQHAAYRSILPQVDTEWVCFLDADEFLVLHNTETVASFLERFDRSVSVVSMNWRIFGSAGREAYDPDPTFVRFTKASLRSHQVNRHLKYFARRAELTEPFVHHCKTRLGRTVNDVGEEITVDRFTWADVSHRAAQVNHYLLRSRGEFLEKKLRGRVSQAHTDAPAMVEEKAESYYRAHNTNDVSDLSALRIFHRYEIERAIIDNALSR